MAQALPGGRVRHSRAAAAIERAPSRTTMRSRLRPGEQFGEIARLRQDQVGGRADAQAAARVDAACARAGAARHGVGPVGERDSRDARCARPRARLPACRDRHRRRTGRACCRWRSSRRRRRAFSSCSAVTPRQRGVRPGVAVLQVHVAHRQRDDADAGLRDESRSCARARRRPGAPASSNGRRGSGRESGARARSRRSRASERAAGSAVSSTWKSRSQPLRSASANRRVERLLQPRDHVGHGAEHAASRARRPSPRSSPCAPSSSAKSIAEQRRRPAGRCGRASARAPRRTTGQEIRVCGPTLSRWVRIARVPCA